MSGLVALESAIKKLERAKTFVVIAGVQQQPREVLARGGIVDAPGKLAICSTNEAALEAVRQHLAAPK